MTTAPDNPAPAPLAGIKVVDLSKILAGPYVTMSLADLGAEVIKIEHPDGGDPTRGWGPPFVGDDATYYLAINRGKKSVSLDLKSEEGQHVVHQLLADADVVVDNFRPGSSLERIFDYRALSKRYPRLVVLHISAFGDDGPLRDEPGYDMIAQAAGGLMSLTGEPDGAPMRAGYAMGDLGAALFGLIGLLAALVERSRTDSTSPPHCSNANSPCISTGPPTGSPPGSARTRWDLRTPTWPHIKRFPLTTGTSSLRSETICSGPPCARPSTAQNWRATPCSCATATE